MRNRFASFGRNLRNRFNSAFGVVGGSDPTPGFDYLRPDGTSYYLRPDGTSYYLRP